MVQILIKYLKYMRKLNRILKKIIKD